MLEFDGILIDKEHMKDEVERVGKALQKIGSRAKHPIMTKTAQAMAKDIARQAKENAPRATGELKSSIKAGKVSFSGSNISVSITAGASHAGVMDTGFNVEEIRPVNAKVLRIPVTGKRGLKKLKRPPGLKNKQWAYQKARAKKIGFIFRPRVMTPELKSRGEKGPNQYLARVLERIANYPEREIRKISKAMYKGVGKGRKGI